MSWEKARKKPQMISHGRIKKRNVTQAHSKQFTQRREANRHNSFHLLISMFLIFACLFNAIIS